MARDMPMIVPSKRAVTIRLAFLSIAESRSVSSIGRRSPKVEFFKTNRKSSTVKSFSVW